MAYFDHRLDGGERIVYRTKMHPAIFCWSSPWILVSAAAFVLGFTNLAQICLGASVVAAIYLFVLRLLSDFVVTNRRVLGKFLTSDRQTHYAEVALVEVRAVDFKPGFFSRFFDYGTVVIADAQAARSELQGVPGEFYRQIDARVARIQRILQ